MKKPYTLDDLEKKYFTPEEIAQMNREVEEEVRRINGGARPGAGRKPKKDNVLKFQVRVSEEEKVFLKYAREHKLDYKKLMQS